MKPSLSERELQVLDYATQGYTDDMIAQALGIGKGTVNSYWVRIRGKMGHLSRTHLVANHIQSKATTRQAAFDQAASDRADASAELMNVERSKHVAELEARDKTASDLAEKNRIVLEKAEDEIERLKGLLKNRGK